MDQQKQAHFVAVSQEINDKLTDLIMTYDSKILATVLCIRAARLFQAIQAANLWSQDDVSAVIQGAFAEVHEPIAAPRIITVDPKQGRMN